MGGRRKVFSYFEAEQLRAARDVNFTEVAQEVRDSCENPGPGGSYSSIIQVSDECAQNM